MEIQNILNGAKIMTLPATQDARGSFVKTFHETSLREAGVEFVLRESYFSVSKKNVIRGMHFQLPPHQHAKVVFCPHGAILDVIVDLRKGSKSFGEHYAAELSAANNKAYYIPEGFAHGFKALTDDAMTYYLVSSEYDQQHDKGIRYNTIGFDWGITDPIVSIRDLSLARMDVFDSPF